MLKSARRFGAFLILPVLAIALGACGSSDPSPGKIATNPAGPTAPPSSSTTNPASAAGKPCVAEVTADAPAGAPPVPVKVGPPPTTLIKEDLEVGDGDEVVATSSVTVDYIGVACSTGKIFDSSYKAGQPATFALNQVIKGWSEGLVGMKVGGVRLLGIPSDLAYGPSGQGADIGPDEALWFVVTLKSIS